MVDQHLPETDLVRNQFPTLICTSAANFSTSPAMVCIVLFAFSRASVANICANFTLFRSTITAKAHQLCCSITRRSAFQIKLNTPNHHFHVFFPETRYRAMIAE